MHTNDDWNDDWMCLFSTQPRLNLSLGYNTRLALSSTWHQVGSFHSDDY